MFRHIFRPSILIALSAAVVVGASSSSFNVRRRRAGQRRCRSLDGGREIVWLYPATNATSWERFVTAVRRTAERLQHDRPDCRATDNAAFPRQTTAVPQVSLSWAESGPRFVFRWYKLTSDWKTGDWIEALLKRQPPPLAIIGGSSSDSARELATHLNHYARAAGRGSALLLLTTATADRVAPFSEGESFADSNEHSGGSEQEGRRRSRTSIQAALFVSASPTSRWPRPSAISSGRVPISARTRDPLYMAMWNDDSYSRISSTVSECLASADGARSGEPVGMGEQTMLFLASRFWWYLPALQRRQRSQIRLAPVPFAWRSPDAACDRFQRRLFRHAQPLRGQGGQRDA